MADATTESEKIFRSGSLTEVRLVLLGLTGSGRSSAGNTILGREAFRSGTSPLSVTSLCESSEVVLEGRRLQVVDTPGFFHTSLSPDQLRAELSRSLELCSPGPHGFLLVLRPGRLTREARAALEALSGVFGHRAPGFTLLLLTGGDALGKPAHAFLKESEELWEFASKCAGGCHVLDNTAEERSQVTALFRRVEDLMRLNAGSHYTKQMWLQAQEEEGERHVAGGRVFWCELLTAAGRGAAEASGLMDKSTGKKGVIKTMQRAAAITSSPLPITVTARVVGGAFREGHKVLQKHKKTLR